METTRKQTAKEVFEAQRAEALEAAQLEAPHWGHVGTMASIAERLNTATESLVDLEEDVR